MNRKGCGQSEYDQDRSSCISEIIDLKRLEHESRKWLYAGFCIAVVFHAVLALMIKFERVQVRISEPRTHFGMVLKI